jgi:hypothetical protein
MVAAKPARREVVGIHLVRVRILELSHRSPITSLIRPLSFQLVNDLNFDAHKFGNQSCQPTDGDLFINPDVRYLSIEAFRLKK